MRADLATVEINQAPDQRKTDTEPSRLAVERVIGLREEVEHLWQHVPGDAGAVVAYADHGLLGLLRHADGELAARLGVLGRVVQEVAHYLAQPGHVGVHRQRPFRQLYEK